MIPLPSSQFSDVKPALQLHVYESPDWVQCPPFSHGFGKHGDISSGRKKKTKKKTGMVRCKIIKTDVNYSMMAVQHYRRYIYRHLMQGMLCYKMSTKHCSNRLTKECRVVLLATNTATDSL